MYYSAIPSWYGYRYQGQLAIYYAIKEIKEILGKINESNDVQKESALKEKLEKYALEIEYMEDFAIRYHEDVLNFKYISFHQVKAGDSKGKIDKEAIYGVIENLIESRNYPDGNRVTKETIGYIHVPDNSHDLVEYDFKKIYTEQRNKRLNELQKILSIQDDWKSLSECIKGTGDKYSVKKLIHDELSRCNLGKTEKNHEKIKNTILKIQSEIKGTIFPDSGVNLQIYSDIYFKSIEEIEVMIISTIADIHNKFNKYEKFMENNSIKKKVLPQLIQKLTEYIDEIKKNPKSNPFINFINIYEFIVKIPEEVDLNYEAYRFRVNIANSFPMYTKRKCFSQEIYDCTSCKESDKCNLARFMEEFKGLSVTQVSRLLKNIAVARNIFSSEQQIPADVDIHRTIFKYLREVNKFKLEKETRISAYKNKKNYWCTCESEISIDDLNDYKSNIVDVLFEADFLITYDTSEELNVSDVLTSFNEDEIQNFSTEIKEKLKEENSKFLKSKTIKAINIEMAKEVLCND